MRLSWLVILSALLLLVAPSCGLSEADVQAEIKQANNCTVASDCVNVGAYCPYGCNILVNKNNADSIRALLSSHSNSACAYDCVAIGGIACEDQVCVAK